MKKTITMLLFLVLTFGIFAQSSNYTEDDLTEYLQNAPGSKLPNVGEKITIRDGFFSIEDAVIDGNGVDYLVKDLGARLSTMIYSKYIYIYSEKMETRKMWEGRPSPVMNATEIEIVYTGKTAPIIDEYGQRKEVPIFIGY